MTTEMFSYELEMLISIVVAVILGFAIGFERKCRAKEAGMRTHTIVCAGAALMMSLSKYAFADIPSYDAARVAAQIVSGVGFLGAGIIVYRKNQIHGLTTAAGVWATAGVGMAAGSRMYLVAVGSTIILILIQCLMHLNLQVFQTKHSYRLRVHFNDNVDPADVKKLFDVKHFQNLLMKQTSDGIVYQATLFTDKEVPSEQLSKIMHEHTYITALERCDDD